MTEPLYIVATPIGNSEDITLRAIEVLKSADYIACEDTRVTKFLCDKYDIKAELFDCHKFNEKQRSSKILSLLRENKKVALVSDAGTPGISDPGGVLIEELIKNDIKIISIPGACAVTTFLSMIPRNTEEYAFIGFLPRTKSEKEKILNKYKYVNCVFYESPQRIKQTLSDIAELYGNETKTAIGRELTKVFEEVKIGSVKEIIEYYENNPLKGEIVVMIFSRNEETADNDFIIEKIKLLEKENFSKKDITKILTKLYGLNKNTVYDLILKIQH